MQPSGINADAPSSNNNPPSSENNVPEESDAGPATVVEVTAPEATVAVTPVTSATAVTVAGTAQAPATGALGNTGSSAGTMAIVARGDRAGGRRIGAWRPPTSPGLKPDGSHPSLVFTTP
ncbi:MAG: hypothetical protein R2704_16100 [Microthrixaceae bacterium]